MCFPAKVQKEPNLFFPAVIFGIYYLNAKESPATDLLVAINSIKPDKFSKLRKIKQDIMLDYTVFGYLDKCLLLNNVLARNFGCFLRFYERRKKYRYKLRKKLKSKNEIQSEISSCALQKFNSYEFLREELRHYEKKILSRLTLSTNHQKTQKLQFTLSLHRKFTWHMLRFVNMAKKD